MKLFYIVLILFQISSFSCNLLTSKAYQDFLSLTELSSHSSHQSQQSFTPISLDEFEFRITSFMLKELKHDKPTILSSDKLGNFENAFRYNKMYKCLFGNNLGFSTKVLFHLIRIKLRQCERILQKEEIGIKKPLNNLQDLKLIMQDLMSVGQNIMCHKEIQNVEKRVDPNINKLLTKYRETKDSLLENLLTFLLKIVDKYFGRYYDENSQIFVNPREFNVSVLTIRKYWRQNFQDLDYFDTSLHLITLAMHKVFAGKYADQENVEKWGKYFGKFCYEFFKLKHILINETPFINIKKESSSFYHILRILTEKLEYYYRSELGNDDNENIFRVSRQFIDVASSAFLVSSIWHVFFLENNEFIMSEIPSEFNFKDDFMKIYSVSGQADINYRTCSEINEMEEILLMHSRICDSLNEVSFTYDIELITNLLDYKPALDSLYTGVCESDPELCLDVLFDEKKVQAFAKVILKVDSSFNARLVKLRKYGPITHIGISQNVFEENYYIKMGYMAPYQSNDTSIMLWICRACGGGYGISEIKFQNGKLKDFSTVMPDPTVALNIFQIYENVVILAQRTLINSQVLCPLEAGEEKHKLMSNMVWDDDANSSKIWESMGYFNTRTGFYVLFNDWNFVEHDWSLEDYPKIFNPHWRLENKCFCVITIGDNACKREIITRFNANFDEFLSYEDSFDEYVLWTYRTDDVNVTIDVIQEKIKGYHCELMNVFETKPNSNFVLIDEKNRVGLIKDRDDGDRKAADLYFERVPQKTLYICYQWLYPSEESVSLDLENLSLSNVKNILRAVSKDKLSFYKEVLCDPTSRRFCSFIDDDYLKKRNYLDVHVLGITGSFPALSSSLNYVKAINPLSSEKNKSICQELYQKLPSIHPLDINQTEDMLLQFQGLFQKIANQECEISKIFPFEIPCPNRLKFIKQVDKYGLDYLCGEKFEDVEKNLTKEEMIPIQRDFFLNVRITQTPLDKINYNSEEIKALNYHFMAYWIRFPIRTFANKQNKIFYFLVTVFIRINVHHYNFIGLADTYSQATCIDLNKNYDRYISGNKSRFERDSFIYRHEQAFFNSVKPRKLEFYQEKYNLGSVGIHNWKIFLKKTQCEFARFWIPITWRGDGASSCNNIFAVKSLKVLPNRGIEETCDGTKLPIYNVYYMEILAYSDPSSPEFKEPSALDLDIARKHGYIPYGNKLQTYTVIEGYHTKIRLWVKPKAKINSLRKVVCKGINDDENIVPPIGPTPPPIIVNQDIFSRVTVLSNEMDKFRDNDC